MKKIKLNLSRSIELDEFCKKYNLTEYKYPWVGWSSDLFDTLIRNSIMLDEDIIISMVEDGYSEILNYYKVRSEVIENLLDNNPNTLISLEVYIILSKQKVSFEFMMNRLNNKWYWTLFSRTQPIIIQKFDEVKDYVNMDFISRSLPIDRKFIDKYSDIIDWSGLSVNPSVELTDQDIIDFSNKLNLNLLSETRGLSENIIDRFQDKVKWSSISHISVLSEDFIKRNKDKLTWSLILSNQRGRGLFNDEEKERYNNPLNLYDLGRDDWFIGYIKEIVTDNGLKIYSPVLPSYTDFDRFNNHDPNSIKKARVFYKDVITLNKFKKVDIIREYSGEKEVNFYKR